MPPRLPLPLSAALAVAVVLAARPASATAQPSAAVSSATAPVRPPVPAAAPAVPPRAPLVTDRPDFTESPSVVGARRTQLETGQTRTREGGAVATSFGEGLVRVGVTARAELRIGLNSYVRRREARTTEAAAPGGRPGPLVAGYEDPSVGAKLALVPEGHGLVPATSLLVGTSLPVGSAAMRAGGAEPEAKLAASWDLADGWALSSNLNVGSRVGDTGRRVVEPAASLSLGHEFTARVGGYAEAYGFRPRGEAGTQYVNGGLTLGVTPDLQLDARAGAGVGANRGDRFAGLGLARRW